MCRLTYTYKRLAIGLFSILLLLFYLTLFGGSIGFAQPRYGGRLIFGGEDDAWGFDAIEARNLWGIGFISGSMVMERLFELGPNRELIPVLGLSAKMSEDGKTWTVTLREGVSFHDGTPFNAEAVVAHWQRLLNPENRYRGRFVLTPIESVKKTGEFVVTFHLKHAWMPFIDALTNERGFTALIPSPKAVKEGVQNRSPVGTGPFIFKKWKSDDHILVKKNPNYWQAGKPYLNEVVLKVISEHEARYAALVSGQVDLIVTDRPQHVNKLRKNAEFSSVRWNSGIAYFALNTAKPPLDDLSVRRAMAYAWDQRKYLKTSFKDIYEPAQDVLSGAIACEDVSYKDHDLNKAKSLLANHSMPIKMQYLHTATKRGQEAGAIAQQIFKHAGIAIDPVAMDFAGIVRNMFRQNYNMASWILPRSSDMGPMLFASFHSKGPWNVTKFSDEKVDELLARQRLSQDRSEREAIFCQIARIVNEQVPIIYLFKRDYFLFSQNAVKGIPTPAYALVRLSDAWLEK